MKEAHQEQQQRSGDGWSLEAKLYAPEGRAAQVTQADPVGSTKQSCQSEAACAETSESPGPESSLRCF